MVFTGTYEHTIDAKNRLAVPSEVRTMLARDGDRREGDPIHLFVTLGEERTLCLYTEQGFEQRARELDDSELDAGELLEYERLMFSLARRVELDGQGRIRLPDNLLRMAELDSEVVLIGVKDHLEIRDRGRWQSHVQRLLAERPEMLMNPRRAMRRRPADS